MEVGFPKNIRAMIIGSSETGKTYQVIKLLKRNILHHNNIWVISNNDSTLNQPLYKEIKNKLVYNKRIKKPNFGDGDFIIIDDIDEFPRDSWLTNLSTIESHHSNLSVVYICHKWKTGSVALRGSVEFVFLFYNPEDIFSDICKELGINNNESEIIMRELNNPKGIKSKKGVLNSFKNHNHILFDRRYDGIKNKLGKVINRNRIARYNVCGKYFYL
jgi:hypothetical protein